MTGTESKNPQTGQSGSSKIEARPSSPPIRVSVIEFEPMRALGIQTTFEKNPSIEIIIGNSSEPKNGGWLDPAIQVAILGTQLGAGTQKLIESIRSARPSLPILVVSPAAGDEAILSVLNAGAKGFLHDGATAVQFEEAIRVLASGSIWASRRLLGELIHRLLSSRQAQVTAEQVALTRREREVLDLILDGKSNREIAEDLKIEERTVKSYVTRLLRKMSVKNRTALSMLALSGQQH